MAVSLKQSTSSRNVWLIHARCSERWVWLDHAFLAFVLMPSAPSPRAALGTTFPIAA